MKWIPGQLPYDYPEVISRTIDLTGPEPAIEAVTLGRSNNDFIIENILIQYPEIGPAPSTFVLPSLTLTELCWGTVYLNNVNIIGFTTPANFFPGTSGLGFNQQWQGSTPLGYYIPRKNAFELKFRNYFGAGNPGTLDISFKGRRLRPGYFKAGN